MVLLVDVGLSQELCILWEWCEILTAFNSTSSRTRASNTMLCLIVFSVFQAIIRGFWLFFFLIRKRSWKEKTVWATFANLLCINCKLFFLFFLGVGAIYVRRRPRVRLEPLQSGGGQERGLRSGTVPTPLAVGLGAACEVAQQEMEVGRAIPLSVWDRSQSIAVFFLSSWKLS